MKIKKRCRNGPILLKNSMYLQCVCVRGVPAKAYRCGRPESNESSVEINFLSRDDVLFIRAIGIICRWRFGSCCDCWCQCWGRCCCCFLWCPCWCCWWWSWWCQNFKELIEVFLFFALLQWPIPGFFTFIFCLFNTIKCKCSIQILPMTEFEPWTSGVGSDCSTNWATTTVPLHNWPVRFLSRFVVTVIPTTILQMMLW